MYKVEEKNDQKKRPKKNVEKTREEKKKTENKDRKKETCKKLLRARRWRKNFRDMMENALGGTER